MPEVQTGIPGQKLAKRYGLKGQVFAPSVEPIIVPVAVIDWLADAEPALRWANVGDREAANVGLQSQTALSNPTGSQVLLENISVMLVRDTNGWITAFEAGPALASGTTELWADRRLPGNPVGVVTSGVDAGAVTGGIADSRALSNAPLIFDFVGQVLLVGDKIHVLAQTVNTSLGFYWRWTERAETAEERF